MAYAYVLETSNLLRGLASTGFTVSSGPSDSTRAYLNDKRADKRYDLTSAATGITISVDLGSAMSPDTAAVINHNFQSVGAGTKVIAVVAADDAAFTVNAVTMATATLDASSPRPRDTCLSWAPTAKRYWRFSFAWTGGGNAALSIGELLLGVGTSLSRGEQDGSGETETVRAPVVELANGGTRGIFIAGPVLERSLVFSDFTEAQRDILRTMWRNARGPTVPLLWCESWTQGVVTATISEAAQRCIWGHLEMPSFGWRWSDWALVKPPDLVIRAQGREVGA